MVWVCIENKSIFPGWAPLRSRGGTELGTGVTGVTESRGKLERHTLGRYLKTREGRKPHGSPVPRVEKASREAVRLQ